MTVFFRICGLLGSRVWVWWLTYCWEGSSQSMNNANGVCGSSQYFVCYIAKSAGWKGFSYIGKVLGGLSFVK